MKFNPFMWSFRYQMLFGFAVCVALLAYAIFAQFGQLYEPCPLCIFQRIAMATVALIGLVAAVHAPKAAVGRAIYGLLAFLAAATGAGIAARHVWLQHLPPDQVPACGPPLAFMIEIKSSWAALINDVLKGSGECAQVDWTFLGFSMPEWTLLCFVLLAIGALRAGLQRR